MLLVQTSNAIAEWVPPGGTPCRGGFSRAVQDHGPPVAMFPSLASSKRSEARFWGVMAGFIRVDQQLGLSQLLQIVAALRSGCVRLTYRIPAQVWHKGGDCRSATRGGVEPIPPAAQLSGGWPNQHPGTCFGPTAQHLRGSTGVRNKPGKSPRGNIGTNRARRSKAPTTGGLATGLNPGYS